MFQVPDCGADGLMARQVTTLLGQVDPKKVDPTKRAAAEAEVASIREKIAESLAKHEELMG